MTDDLQDFYGRWARLYDAIARFPGVGAWRDAAVRSLALEPGDTVVEMGCGTGANFPYLRERVGSRGWVVGIDLTPGMLAVAAKRIAANDWGNVSLLRADAARPPIGAPSDGPVDAVLASFVVGMFGDPRPVVERWCSLLEPGGRICLLDARLSSRPLARPFDLAFRGFVVVSTPPTRKIRYDDPPWAELDRRVEAAHEALTARCSDTTRSTHGLGFVRLRSGRVR